MPTFRSDTLSVTIDRDWQAVYDFASRPANMHIWAAGLGSDFRPVGDEWVLRDPGGKNIRMRFTPNNPYGVLDHDVFAGDQTVHVAMRVVPNGDGAEVTFLLIQAPSQSNAEYERDAAAVRKDLLSLKAVLERR